MVLNEQELRNCVYRGPFNDLLAELEVDVSWRRVKGGAAPEPRFKEREIILRFFAFADRLQYYTGNLKRFLNEYMGAYAPQRSDALTAHAELFRQTMKNIYAVFGQNSARLYEVNPRTKTGGWDTKFSVTAFDIQASALMNQPPIKVQRAAEQIRELFLFTLLTDVDIQTSITKATGSAVQTKTRWTKFRALADPIISGTVIEPRFFDFEFRKQLYEKSSVCQLCKNEIHSLEDSTVDHIMPYSKGGKTISSNGQLAHRACNASKNAEFTLGG
jgi:HNH endonuclease